MNRTSAFLDTNILLYSISDNPSERHKRSVSEKLLSDPESALSMQVLQEFYVQATRPTHSGRLSHAQASSLVFTWTRFRVQEITREVFFNALRIRDTFQLSYWDSAIVAAAQELGCSILYTEDLSHGQAIETLSIVDPFQQ